MTSLLRRCTGNDRLFLAGTVSVLLSGCAQMVLDRTDRAAYRVIEDRQRAAVGIVADANLGEENSRLPPNSSMYEFVPRPVGGEVPPEFQPTAKGDTGPPTGEPASGLPDQTRADPPVGGPVPPEPEKAAVAGSSAETVAAAGTEPPPEPGEISPSIFTAEELPHVQTFHLSDALAYAMRFGREVQNAKEELYLAALDLTLERHLWTPQFVGSITTDYANFGQVNDFDHAMSAVSDLAVTQRLPFGGDVTARVINTLMHDLTNHVTSGESGSFILEADVPLLRGAGRTAYESRYVAEREMIYAVRDFEHFRRSFTVLVARAYFDLQQNKAAIANAFKSYRGRREDWLKAEFEHQVGRARNVFDVTRVRSTYRSAEADLVSSKEQYASTLDRFKILLGMSVKALLDVVDQEDDQESEAFAALLPEVVEETATNVALYYRLDLLNSADRADDAQRGVNVARNRILPDLDLSGSMTMATDPERLNSASYNSERTTWRAAAQLRLDDRKTERNAYRAALVAWRRAQRENEQAADNVRADVRRAIRRIEQQKNLLAIQESNVEENRLRLEAAQAQYELGMINNRDVVEADIDLLEARNALAAAVADYRNAILEFRRDTATLRVDDQGRWDGLSEADPAKLRDVR